MKARACLTFVFLFCTASLAQRSVAQEWTNQNNLQMSAAYMLQNSYYERGYRGARVQVSQQRGKDVFTVAPGPIYHFKSVTVTGLPENAMTVAMQDAPKAGDVYSAARVNEWLADVKKGLQYRVRTKRSGGRRRFDHATASATVMIAFHE